MGLCTCHFLDPILIQVLLTSSVKVAKSGQAELGAFFPFCSYDNSDVFLVYFLSHSFVTICLNVYPSLLSPVHQTFAWCLLYSATST